ncbi:unnamed protein product [Rangifer tarandus platyrhynchus]|uniref:Uncharacterized protein n=1 Tax=Rangifer tarandus platyrhynchus TaxID=3082113 RepID=A0AC59Y8H5_RANTA
MLKQRGKAFGPCSGGTLSPQGQEVMEIASEDAQRERGEWAGGPLMVSSEFMTDRPVLYWPHSRDPHICGSLEQGAWPVLSALQPAHMAPARCEEGEAPRCQAPSAVGGVNTLVSASSSVDQAGSTSAASVPGGPQCSFPPKFVLSPLSP